jgi:hypothetical protein
MKPPVHLTRRQALWASAGVLLFDWVWIRLVLPQLLSARSDLALAVGIVGSVALVVAHIDVVWSFIDPADSPKWEGPKVLITCAFCGAMTGVSETMLENAELPKGWTAFRHGHGQNVNGCGKPECRVAMSKTMAESLIATAKDSK